MFKQDRAGFFYLKDNILHLMADCAFGKCKGLFAIVALTARLALIHLCHCVMNILLHCLIMTRLAAYVRRVGAFLLQMRGVAEHDLARIFGGKSLVLYIERHCGDGITDNRSCE